LNRVIAVALLITFSVLTSFSCNRQVALLTPAVPTATPTSTSTSTSTRTFTPTKTYTNTPSAPTNTPSGPAPTATPTIAASGGVTFESFDAGGAECCYSDPQAAPLPSWLAAPWTPGGSTTSQAVTCQTNVAHGGTHSMMDIINFDSSSDLAELGLYSWDAWGGAVNASSATNNYGFWAQASGPVSIANLFICNASCSPEIGWAGVNLLLPGDGQWHYYAVPLGSPNPPSPWAFVSGVAPWTNSSDVEVFFDMVGPPGPVTVYYDDIAFYP
jgi:hypothetical protein